MKKENLPDRETVLISVTVFVLTAALTFSALNLLETSKEQSRQPEIESLNVTLNQETNVVTAEFFNQSIDLMKEDGENVTFYLDFNRDGSFDSVLTGLERDGEEHVKTELLTLGGQDYELSFRYRDNSSTQGEAYLQLFMVKKVGR